MPNHDKKAEILTITKTEQYRTVNELFEKSQPNSWYFTFLFLSVFIITSGLLLNNGFIVLGGMLLTPLLTPVLVTALGFAVGEIGAIKNAALLMGRSFLIIAGTALVFTFIFGVSPSSPVFENNIRTAMLYFIVALTSGVAATFAWTRKESSEAIAGIAIAISLVPPLGLVGIWLSVADFATVQFYFLVFLFNLLGVLVGSSIAFSLLKFHRSEQKVHQKANEIQKIDQGLKK